MVDDEPILNLFVPEVNEPPPPKEDPQADQNRLRDLAAANAARAGRESLVRTPGVFIP